MIVPRLHIVVGIRENREAEPIYIGNDGGIARDAFMSAGKDGGFAVALLYHYPMANRTRRFKPLDSLAPAKPFVSKAKQPAKAKPADQKPAPAPVEQAPEGDQL